MFSIRRPPAEIFGAPTKYFLLSPKKKKKKNKIKGRHYFFGFSYRLLAPPGAFWRPLKLFGAPWSFLYPQIFFPHHRTLIWPTYGTFLQQNNFNFKFWRPLLMAPPGNRGYVTPLGSPIIYTTTHVWIEFIKLSSHSSSSTKH